jgi:hypothetical protein
MRNPRCSPSPPGGSGLTRLDGERIVPLNGSQTLRGQVLAPSCGSFDIEALTPRSVAVPTLTAHFGHRDHDGPIYVMTMSEMRSHDQKAVAQRLTELDRRIENYVRAIGDGLDPLMCRGQIDELTAQKGKLEEEAAILRRDDYYSRAVEKNLVQLGCLRDLADSQFDRLTFGLQRQFVMQCLRNDNYTSPRRQLHFPTRGCSCHRRCHDEISVCSLVDSSVRCGRCGQPAARSRSRRNSAFSAGCPRAVGEPRRRVQPRPRSLARP